MKNIKIFTIWKKSLKCVNSERVQVCCCLYLLITALSSESRKTRGRTLPSCGSGVTVPTSTKPNPSLNIPSTASPCLSNPAAKPIGLPKFRFHRWHFWQTKTHFYHQKYCVIKFLITVFTQFILVDNLLTKCFNTSCSFINFNNSLQNNLLWFTTEMTVT